MLETCVAGEGLEPSTSRFEALAIWLRLALERAEMELYWAAWRVRKFLPVRMVTAYVVRLLRTWAAPSPAVPLFFASKTSNRAVRGVDGNAGNAGSPAIAGNAATTPIAGHAGVGGVGSQTGHACNTSNGGGSYLKAHRGGSAAVVLRENTVSLRA